jgi:phosphoglycerate dehydrogenase-like enzyme
MRQGSESWVQAFPSDIDPRERELTGRTVGIVGLGQVGRRLAELLAPFHVDLHVADPFVPEEVISGAGGRRCTLEEMVDACDVVILCAAANKGTSRLFNPSLINRLKPNAVLVNVARASLVDTGALLERLAKGNLFAAIDVFDQEPLPADDPLRRMENACLTPHRSGGLLSSVRRTVEWLVDDYERFLSGEPRKYAVTEAMIPSLDS